MPGDALSKAILALELWARVLMTRGSRVDHGDEAPLGRELSGRLPVRLHGGIEARAVENSERWSADLWRSGLADFDEDTERRARRR